MKEREVAEKRAEYAKRLGRDDPRNPRWQHELVLILTELYARGESTPPAPPEPKVEPPATLEERSRRFNDGTGALSGGNSHPDRCVCQTEPDAYPGTPHKHYDEPPFACARCGCKRYRPAVPEATQPPAPATSAETAVPNADDDAGTPAMLALFRSWEVYDYPNKTGRLPALRAAYRDDLASATKGLRRDLECVTGALADAQELAGANAQAARELAELRRARAPKNAGRVCAIYFDADEMVRVEQILDIKGKT